MLILWNVYNVKSKEQKITGVMLRGRVRKYCIGMQQNVLVENSDGGEEEVRFALPTSDDPQATISYIKSIIPDADIKLLLENIPNPVLSKIKVNDDSRYVL